VGLPFVTALTTLFSYGLLFAFGQLRDHRLGYAPICLGLEDFYTRRLYLRIQVCSNDCSPLGYELSYNPGRSYDPFNELYIFMTTNVLMWQNCFSRPIASAPDAWVDVVDRYSNDNNKTLQ
ncbi:hypothetical protein B296_00016573, partial [Ensete ventricosum]